MDNLDNLDNLLDNLDNLDNVLDNRNKLDNLDKLGYPDTLDSLENLGHLANLLDNPDNTYEMCWWMSRLRGAMTSKSSKVTKIIINYKGLGIEIIKINKYNN